MIFPSNRREKSFSLEIVDRNLREIAHLGDSKKSHFFWGGEWQKSQPHLFNVPMPLLRMSIKPTLHPVCFKLKDKVIQLFTVILG